MAVDSPWHSVRCRRGVDEFRRQQILRHVLIGDRPQPAPDRARTDRRVQCVGGRRIRAAVVHRPRDRDTRRIAVPDNATHAAGEDVDQAAGQRQVVVVRVNAGGESWPHLVQQVDKLVVAAVADDDENRSEAFFEDGAIERRRGDFKE